MDRSQITARLAVAAIVGFVVSFLPFFSWFSSAVYLFSALVLFEAYTPGLIPLDSWIPWGRGASSS